MKRLKRIIMSLVLVTCMIGTSSSITASSFSTGKAIIPIWSQDVNCASYFMVSNITDNPINVTITFYNNTGTLFTDDNSSTTGFLLGTSELLNYDDQNLDSSVSFTMNAHCTGVISFPPSSFHRGYGVIQWNQDGNELQGLVAWGELAFYKTGAESRTTVDINGGLPF